MKRIIINKQEYLTRTLRLQFPDGEETTYVISDECLEKVLDIENNEEHQEIDDQISYYVDQDVFYLDADIIAANHLDEPFSLIEEIDGDIPEKYLALSRHLLELEIESIGNFGNPAIEDMEIRGWFEGYAEGYKVAYDYKTKEEIAENMEFEIREDHVRALARECMAQYLEEYKSDYDMYVSPELYLEMQIREKYPLPKIKQKTYKLWITIEEHVEFDDGSDEYRDLKELDTRSVGTFTDMDDALEQMNSLGDMFQSDGDV